MTNLHGKRILVVEDDIVNLAIISSLLRRHGAAVYEINPRFHEMWLSPDDFRLKRALPVDIILTDIMLPNNITGYDIYDSLRAVPALANVPVVAVTALNNAQEMNKARTKGFAGYISKPLRAHTFAAYINDVLVGKPVWISDY